MKSEERHDLKTHELGRLVERAAPFFKQYENYILWGLVAVIVVATLIVAWVRTTGSAAASGWNELAASSTAEDFANVADQFAGSEVGAWARLNEADRHLQSGIRLSFTDRKSAVSDLEKAQESYEKLLEAKNVPPSAREKGLFGLARCLEITNAKAKREDIATAGKDTTEAVAAYEKLLQEFPDTIYKDTAEQRIKELKKAGTQDFYAWFRAQNPTPPDDRDEPQDGQSPFEHPPFESSDGKITLPEIPPLLQLPKSENAAESSDETSDAEPDSSEPTTPEGEGAASQPQ